MSLPSPILDDLRFQRDLVDEARRRIIRYCPEWTEYNLSDPGITLIELFAWMTEMITYRLNQVPEKNYIEFLNLLGMQRQPASSARVDLTFWLSVALPLGPDDPSPVIVPAGTEVVSRPTSEGQVTFTTDRRLVVVPPLLTQLRRDEDLNKNYLPRLGIEAFHAFGRKKPAVGDMFYLGFDMERDIRGHLLRLTFDCEATQAVGVRREDPPWVWECSMGNGIWYELTPSVRVGEKDTTGGLNNPRGSLVLYLPLDMELDLVHGREAFWIRCRLEARRPEQGMYTESPRVIGLQAHTLGAVVPGTHAEIVQEEFLGVSNGEPGQVFALEHAPILDLQDDETVQVEEKRQGELVYVPWRRVVDFAQSDRYDRHFTADTAAGEIRFGPAVRQPDGTVRQYGRVPESGRSIQFARYRRGGGVAGNVPAETLQTLTTSLAYIARVSNLSRASGGRDPETMEEVQARARRELRAQLRAVTASDYESLALNATREVARVKCNMPQGTDGRLTPGTVEVLVVPAAADSVRVGDLSRLAVDEQLARTVEEYLDQYRLLTTILRVDEPGYVGVRVRARVVAVEHSRPEIVSARVSQALTAFLSPLPIFGEGDDLAALMDEDWEGWPFGRDLYEAEVLSFVQRVPGVKHVLEVQLFTRPVIPSDEEREPVGDEGALTRVRQRVRVPANSLLCSLAHEIVLVELGEGDDEAN
ncbi:MAG: putative baseplate assembly protein [Chloroflexi bacterium]|nr:putative baseplate assembly protein [Chloroflexota bacterium]